MLCASHQYNQFAVCRCASRSLSNAHLIDTTRQLHQLPAELPVEEHVADEYRSLDTQFGEIARAPSWPALPAYLLYSNEIGLYAATIRTSKLHSRWKGLMNRPIVSWCTCIDTPISLPIYMVSNTYTPGGM